MGLYEIVGWLATEIGAATGVGELIDGYPDWGRPVQAPPVGALEISGTLPGQPNRIGQARGQARRMATLRLWLFARSERELASLLDSLAVWWSGAAYAEIGGQRVEIRLQEGQRHLSESGAQQEAHGWMQVVEVTWS